MKRKTKWTLALTVSLIMLAVTVGAVAANFGSLNAVASDNFEPEEYCGDYLQADLLAGNEPQEKVGTVTVWNDVDILYVRFDVESPWELEETHLNISEDEPEERGALGQYNANQYLVDNDNSFALYEVPLNPEWETIYILAHAAVEKEGESGTDETAFGGEFRPGERQSWFNVIEYTIQECDDEGETPGEYDCQTAWAVGDETFIELGISQRWGWVITFEGENITTDLYVGAAQNDKSKGTLVGVVNVSQNNGELIVTLDLLDGFTMKEAHLYVGSEYPDTAAPGQFGEKSGPLDKVQSHTFRVSLEGLEGKLKLAVHAVVCGEFDEKEGDADSEPEEGVGMPAKYGMTGQEFGEYISDMAKTEPGAVADHVLDQKEKERPEPTEPPDPDNPERGRPKDLEGPNEED